MENKKISPINKKVFLIAPSGFCSKKHLYNSINTLKKWGYEAKYLPDITSKYYYYAGDYKRRAREINIAYKDKETKYIFSVIGGMGAVHVLSYLDYDMIKKSNKILIGYSDVSILLNSIYKKTKNRCIHGPNLWKPLDKFDKTSILSLFNSINKINYNVSISQEEILKKGFARGEIIGGNLTLLGRSLGTPYEIETKNKIVFIEDTKMKDYWILDILWQLKLAGKFDKIKGVILGKFTDCGKNTDNYLKDFFKNFNCPVLINQKIGHEEPNISIPLGEICIINTDGKYWGIKFKKPHKSKPI